MRITCLCVVLFAVTQLNAVPAPAPSHKAKEKLETLKKRLPALLDDWQK
jgi:hypothetical protein